MSVLVNPPQLVAPESRVLNAALLEILHRPSRHPISLKEITRELASRYDRVEVERCLLALSERGLVEPSYTSGYGIGFRAKPLKSWK